MLGWLDLNMPYSFAVRGDKRHLAAAHTSAPNGDMAKVSLHVYGVVRRDSCWPKLLDRPLCKLCGQLKSLVSLLFILLGNGYLAFF